MGFIQKIGVILLVVSLAGCASTGVKIDQAKVQSLQRGKTTYDEVLRDFGRPTNNMVTGNGARTLIYNYFAYQAHPENFIPVVGVFAGGADTETSMVMLKFNASGILEDYTASQGGSGGGRNLESLSQERKDVREVK